MNTPKTPHQEPMSEWSPEPFGKPNTIPAGWDLSEFLTSFYGPGREINFPGKGLKDDQDLETKLYE